MKCLYVVILLILVQTSSWKQTAYRLNTHHIEIYYSDSRYIKDSASMYEHYNRSTRTFSAYGRLLKKLDSPNFKGFGQVYLRVQNEYKIFAPLRMLIDACKSLQLNLFGVAKLVSLGNITYCPINPGFYQVKNFKLDVTQFPPNVPPGHYKAYIELIHNHNAFMNGSIFAEIVYNK